MEIWITVIAVAGGCVLLAALLYFFVPKKQVKIPAVVLGTLGGLAIGAVLGLLGAVIYGDPMHKMVFAEQYKPEPMPAFGGPQPKAAGAPGKAKGGGGGGFAKGGRGGRGGGGGVGGGGDAAKKQEGGSGGGGGGRGGPSGNIYGANYPLAAKKDGGASAPGKDASPGGDAAAPKAAPGMMGPMMVGGNPRNQLDSLVAKLDVLTRKPLSVSLNDDQKAKIREQLKGLADAKDLNPVDAQKRLEALLEILKNDRATLEAAGFVWPGDPKSVSPPPEKPNPFASDASSEHLKGLMGTLGEPKAK